MKESPHQKHKLGLNDNVASTLSFDSEGRYFIYLYLEKALGLKMPTLYWGTPYLHNLHAQQAVRLSLSSSCVARRLGLVWDVRKEFVQLLLELRELHASDVAKVPR